MITGRQIRAARALLDWDAVDLAREAGLSRQTVSRIEDMKTANAQDETMAKITGVFDIQGIEFLDGDGVRMRKTQVRSFSGKTGYRQFLDHVYEELKNGGRIRQFSASDGLYLSYAGDFMETHLARMGEIQNLDARVLQAEGDSHFPAKYCTYRWVDKSNRSAIPYYIYNDYLALPVYTRTNDIEIISIHSKMLTERYVEHFETFWTTAIIPGSRQV